MSTIGWRRVVFCLLLTFIGRVPLITLAPSTSAADDPRRRPQRTLMVIKAKQDVISIIGLRRRELETARKLSTDELGKILSVSVATDADSGTPNDTPILGTIRIEPNGLSFRPRFAFRKGVNYTAVAKLDKLGEREKTIDVTFARPKSTTEPSEVVAVYPTSQRLPENLLKFYLHFSQPMRQGNSYDYLELIDLKENKPVKFPFLELSEELWDPSGKRLTVLFDPGRVKQGLKPREVAGPVLRAGRQYRLQIAPDWPDANGNPLKKSFRKDFETIAADSAQPSPNGWKIRPPTPQSREPLTIVFGESLDHAMLERVITIEVGGQSATGEITIDSNETRWSFTPATPWPSEADKLPIKIHCQTTLEDNAGNSIGRAFEATSGDSALPIESLVLPVPQWERK